MKLSELIKKLQDLFSEHGDLRVIKSSSIWNDDVENVSYEDNVYDEETDKNVGGVIFIE